MLKIRHIEITLGRKAVAVVNKQDAEKLGIVNAATVEISHSTNRRKIIAELRILDKNLEKRYGDVDLKIGEIGLFSFAYEKLRASSKDKVRVKPMAAPKSWKYLMDRVNKNNPMTAAEFKVFIEDVKAGRYNEARLSFYLAMGMFKPFSAKEAAHLALAMAGSGEKLVFPRNEIIADKHSIGGIPGNRTTPIIVAILAAAGLKVPNTFTRSVTSPAGTADTLETYMDVELTEQEMVRYVDKTGACLAWGGNVNLSPTDDLFIQVQHHIGQESEEQLIASILSKKKAGGLTHLLLDIPYGPDAKVKNLAAAKKLGKKFRAIAGLVKLKMIILYTDGTQPIGWGVGPILEMEDVIAVLRNEAEKPKDLKDKSVDLAQKLINFVGLKADALEILESGAAYKKFMEIRKTQGGRELDIKGPFHYTVDSDKKGLVRTISNKTIIKLAKTLGCPLDHKAGVKLHKKKGFRVEKGEKLFTMYSHNETRMRYAKKVLKEDGHGFEIK